jgi:uncharacterized membrane protein YdfJ with MMPL/SSD domain
MTSRHSAPTEAPTRPFIARTIRLLAVPIILGWIALTVVTAPVPAAGDRATEDTTSTQPLAVNAVNPEGQQ